ncbi:UNVERIFIED_CONTAM: Loganic acid O-methyltransferase [Sesamum angustifolium]|uniref:Loganic acid O-methyltransferase n=1 Tax=Sesamum angustifolium TaxID=2727405 RepID=A0AAW2M7R9_9LAMI
MDSNFRIQNRVADPHNSVVRGRMLGQYVMNGGEGPNSYAQNSSYQVFFNDKVTNDFNTLFSSLPPERLYYASGVPGSFHGRLLPKASLHFAYSSCTFNWLSEVPKELADDTSPTWNRAKIHSFGARKEVLEAYSNQYAEDVEAFLDSRAEELVGGGLMALIVPAVPAFWNPNTAYTTLTEFDILGSCLMDLAEKGRFSKAKVDLFNLPLHYTVPQEFKAILERSDDYTLERMEI